MTTDTMGNRNLKLAVVVEEIGMEVSFLSLVKFASLAAHNKKLDICFLAQAKLFNFYFLMNFDQDICNAKCSCNFN